MQFNFLTTISRIEINMENKKKVAFYTLGCKLNFSETSTIARNFNDEGFLFLKGRSKDMIIRGGINIYPQEIETTLLNHEAVADACVVGWPSREYDEEVAAFVTLKQAVILDELIGLCKTKLAPYKVPKQIFVVAELPRNSLGKVLKADLVKGLTPL